MMTPPKRSGTATVDHDHNTSWRNKYPYIQHVYLFSVSRYYTYILTLTLVQNNYTITFSENYIYAKPGTTTNGCAFHFLYWFRKQIDFRKQQWISSLYSGDTCKKVLSSLFQQLSGPRYDRVVVWSLLHNSAWVRSALLKILFSELFAATHERHLPRGIVDLVVMEDTQVGDVVWVGRVAVSECVSGKVVRWLDAIQVSTGTSASLYHVLFQ